MPINGRVVEGLSVVSFDGTFDVDETIAFVERWFPEHPREPVLWDLRRSLLYSFSWQDFHRLAKAGARFAKIRGPDARSAIVVASRIDEQLMFAYNSQQEIISSVDIRVFRCIDCAFVWLHDRTAGAAWQNPHECSASSVRQR